MVTAYHVLVDIFFPVIMIAMFITGIYLIRKSPERVPTLAGLGAGLVGFTIYAVSSFGKLKAIPFNASALPSFQWLPTLAGVALGILALWLLQRFELNAGLMGLFVLLLVASSSIASFSYFFVSPLRSYAIYFTLGMLFGVLVYLIVFWQKLRDIPELMDVLPARRR
jgi:hypothetical protein